MERRNFKEQPGSGFLEVFDIPPHSSGTLDGLTFAVKDLIDIAGRKTGCGNPTWQKTHPPASANAIVVEQLLLSGAYCKGKTITDELAFSLLGENHWYGTPSNPKAPDRIPGGSSSGSASVVACGQVDFALGTDTGGSVRVPASNCGIWGFRPSHGTISLAGVNPLAPTFDTVGVLASSAEVLIRVASVLLAKSVRNSHVPQKPVKTIHLIKEAFEICDPEVRASIDKSIHTLRHQYGNKVKEISLRDIDGETEPGLQKWYEIYRLLQWVETDSTLGSWVREVKPEFGPMIAQSFELIGTADRSRIQEIIERRERYFELMKSFLESDDLLCIPTVPAPAPLKGSLLRRDVTGTGYHPRTLSLTSIAGVARLPQISIPGASAGGSPIGLSFLAAHKNDAFLLAVLYSLSAF